jgi:hypothetical protein
MRQRQFGKIKHKGHKDHIEKGFGIKDLAAKGQEMQKKLERLAAYSAALR